MPVIFKPIRQTQSRSQELSPDTASQLRHETEISDPNLNLLAHAQILELDIGSQCGGHGICGKDRILIQERDREFLSPITSEEKSHLTQSEIAQGWRLGCQCFPEKSDQTIEVGFKAPS